ncbi:MAG TPA: hypothetical protein VFM57_08385 [Thermoleophilaceae bacterium]|nr:hypothetical protein [Thermoleophilaceae bacterium]
MSPNRIVAVLTPLVFAPLAGAVATWIADNVPGANISAGSLEEVFIGGALIGLAPAAQWLHGWQKYEAREAEKESTIELVNATAATSAAQGGEMEADFEDFEDDFADFDGFEDEFEDLDELDDELFADEELVERGG